MKRRRGRRRKIVEEVIEKNEITEAKEKRMRWRMRRKEQKKEEKQKKGK